MALTGEIKSTRGKACASVILSTTNLTWAGLGFNPLLRGDRTANNRLSHVTAFQSRWLLLFCNFS
jgi:hypothetical protein